MKKITTKEITKSLIESISKDEWIVGAEVAVRGTNGRIDVCAVRKRQFLRKQIRGYEVKISRSDFLSDVGSQKWRKYLAVCHQVYFAAPSGLLKKNEIPHGAGLITLGDKGWQVIKSAPVHEPESLDADAVLSILFSTSRQDAEERDKLARLAARNSLNFSDVSREIGGEIGRRLAGLSPQTEKKAERVSREVEKLFGKDKDVIAALRFAAKISPEQDLIHRIGSFLTGISEGYYREDPETMDRGLRSLKKLRAKEDQDTDGGSLEGHDDHWPAPLDKKTEHKVTRTRSKKSRKSNTPSLFGCES